MATRPARLSGGAVAAAVVLLTGGGIAARAVYGAAANARESGARRSAAATARAFESSVESVRRAVDSVATLAPLVARSPQTPPPAVNGVLAEGGISGIVYLPSTGAPQVVTGVLPEGTDVTTLRTSLASALDVSRDTSEAHAGLAGSAIGVAVPVYDGSAATTEVRRTSLRGWVISLVDAPALADRVAADGELVTLRVGGIALTPVVPTDATTAVTTITLGGQPLEATVTAPVEGGAEAVAWATFLAALCGALGALLVGWRDGVALAKSHATTEALERETRTVAEIGPLLQQSLDLAEVLPAVAVRLSDEFALDGIAVELVGEHGDPVDVFSIGRRSTATPEVLVGPEGMVAGVEYALPLQRAARTIGRLRLTPRDTLATTQVDALRGAADLIAVATYNVELYEREQATVRRLQELDKLKDAFLGTISHELRTPITAIGGFARMLNERWDDLTPEQHQDFVRRIGRNSTSLGLLVDDLLDFARLERQALQTNPTPMPLDTVVAGFVAQVVPALGDHPVETDLAEDVVALADPRAIERVLANLLTNAAKFSPPGSPVEVALRAGDESAILTVSDRGPGIAPEDRLRVFTRFYRGESDAARSTRGAGIGLAVVHELVTQMGGDIAVRGREPNGTTMVIRLPLANPSPPVDIDTPQPRGAADDLLPARSTRR